MQGGAGSTWGDAIAYPKLQVRVLGGARVMQRAGKLQLPFSARAGRLHVGGGAERAKVATGKRLAREGGHADCVAESVLMVGGGLRAHAREGALEESESSAM